MPHQYVNGNFPTLQRLALAHLRERSPTCGVEDTGAAFHLLLLKARPAIDKDRAAAIAARGEQIKQVSAEYLRVCCGIKPPPLPGKPVVTNTNVNPEQPQLQPRPLYRAAPTTRQRP